MTFARRPATTTSRIPPTAGTSLELGVVVTVESPSSAVVRISGVDLRAIVAEGPWTPGLRTRPTTISGGGHYQDVGDGEHTHGPHDHELGRELAPGDQVVVGFLRGRTMSPVVIGRIPPA